MYEELKERCHACSQGCNNPSECSYFDKPPLRCMRQLLSEAADAIAELNMELLNAKEFSDYADAIKEMKPKWIPVTENLPAAGQKAICFGKNGCMIGTYGEFGWMFPCYFGNVTHWMNLPEPPKEETCEAQ